MKARIAAFTVLLLALALLPSCGFFGPDNGTSNNGNGNGNGGGGGTPPTGTGIAPRFAYVSNFSGASITALTVNASTGVLSSVVGSPFSGGAVGRPAAVATDPGGNTLFVADQAAGVLSFPINRNDGTLPQLGTALPFVTQLTSAAVTPNAAFLYVVDHTNSQLLSFQIGSLGTMTVLTLPIGLSANPWQVTVTNNGTLAYVANDVAGTDVFTADPNAGFLTLKATVPMLSNGPSRDVAVTPNEKFAYVINGSSGIEAYSVNATTGNLTRIGTSAVSTGTNPVKIAIDPTGNFVYVANNGSNNVSGYKINTDGSLTAVAGSPFAAGNAPSWVAADPSGLFLYVTNQNDNSVTVYALSNTGALTVKATQTTDQPGAGPTSIVITK
jgi:6-phosphogluconolactonase (cycloisomerase 2 family)